MLKTKTLSLALVIEGVLTNNQLVPKNLARCIVRPFHWVGL